MNQTELNAIQDKIARNRTRRSRVLANIKFKEAFSALAGQYNSNSASGRLLLSKR